QAPSRSSRVRDIKGAVFCFDVMLPLLVSLAESERLSLHISGTVMLSRLCPCKTAPVRFWERRLCSRHFRSRFNGSCCYCYTLYSSRSHWSFYDEAMGVGWSCGAGSSTFNPAGRRFDSVKHQFQHCKAAVRPPRAIPGSWRITRAKSSKEALSRTSSLTRAVSPCSVLVE